MNWQELRQQYPHRWLVVEAIGAFTRGLERVIEHLEVRGVFGDDWKEAWEFYKQLHNEDKWREYYVLHTDRPALNIGVIEFIGPRFIVS